jgi:peptide/nickel transport system permease protein
MLARLVHAARQSLLVAGLVALIAGAGGGGLGLVSGYLGGRFDLITQRIVDSLLSMPLLLLALAAMAAYPNSRLAMIVVLSIGFSPAVARITRASALAARGTGYAEAARAMGARHSHVISTHIVPAAVGPWMIFAGTQAGAAILAESSLAFLGFGASASNPSLGTLLGGEAQIYLNRAPWMIVWPGLAISLFVLSINMAAEGMASHGIWPALSRSSRTEP